MICLDDNLRELLSAWAQDQRWGTAMSFKGDAASPAQNTRLDDPTVCLLNTAFTLGGLQFPQRMFSSGMNNVAQKVTGFGWLQ